MRLLGLALLICATFYILRDNINSISLVFFLSASRLVDKQIYTLL